ncbi:CPBP family intramembrane glutamic endopeptidase [Edaphobacter sp.]|uniref:CPBP family intramembrane glutamic endopeptidase n=1 Tax=Edaphobacter sp. TaxID=1934404 RepID=UPI002DB90A62|nr:CPBP family intramembrane glutamic endopeptidase [Edaphobacter sp.]HEU5341849.1 CPBP family intramembrane glutamic endopeptidase [Edaphobacter sp.]
MESSVKARSGLGVFFAVLIAGSAYFEHRILVLGGSIQHHLGLIGGLVWWVTVSSIVARLALREGIRDVSFRWGGTAGTRAVAVATAMPLFVGFAAYGIAWSTGLASFQAPVLPGAPFGMHFAPAHGASMRFFQSLGIMLLFGALQDFKYAAGEEIGWRGYMLTRLVDAKIPAPILISGLVWGLWHAPLIVSGQYASGPHPFLSVCLFIVGIVAAGYVFAWLRLSSGSIWPCIWAHGAWNAIIQGAFDRSTAGPSLWVGESGVLTASMLVLFAVVLYKLWPVTQCASMSRLFKPLPQQ